MQGIIDPHNLAVLLTFVTAVFIPHLSSILSGNKFIPAWAGGYVTLLLAAVSGFCSEWADNVSSYDWKQGLYNAGIAFLVAGMSRLVVHRATPPEATLLRFGSKGAKRSDMVTETHAKAA